MRLIELSAVYNRAEACGKLDHRRVEVLTECVCRKIHHRHVVAGIDQRIGSRLSRQINVGLLTKSENLLVVFKVISSYFIGHLHQRIVAGIHQRLLQCLHSVSVSLDTVNVMTRDRLIPVAVIGVCRGHRPGLKSCRHGKRLRRRSRFIGIRHAEVLPQLV